MSKDTEGLGRDPEVLPSPVVACEEPSKGFAAKVVGAAAQGATAALVAAALSACTEPLAHASANQSQPELRPSQTLETRIVLLSPQPHALPTGELSLYPRFLGACLEERYG